MNENHNIEKLIDVFLTNSKRKICSYGAFQYIKLTIKDNIYIITKNKDEFAITENKIIIYNQIIGDENPELKKKLTKLFNQKDYKTILKKIFGYNDFRNPQEEIIEDIMFDNDVLALMPTGGGKSLCYQIPALLKDGICVVISPLISLMDDQINFLKSHGVSCVSINSTKTDSEIKHIYTNLSSYKLIYLSPERFNNVELQSLLEKEKISFFAIDEAHCISSWGHDFRPEYTNLLHIKNKFNKPIIALTATANNETQKDIINQLGLVNPKIYKSSFDRANIKILIEQKNSEIEQMNEFLSANPNKNGIIYCLSKKKVDSICEYLIDKGYNALSYHAGLSSKLRKENQAKFINENNIIMVATIAFGMGIDKSNVNFVLHLDLPKNIESYYQEIGRAGRDGTDATALLLYDMKDLATRSAMIANSYSSNMEQEYIKLNEILLLAITEKCKRHFILKTFSEKPKFEDCNNCSSCINQKEQVFYEKEANQITKILKEAKNEEIALYPLINFLLGIKNNSKQSITSINDRNFGIMKKYSKEDIKNILLSLVNNYNIKIIYGQQLSIKYLSDKNTKNVFWFKKPQKTFTVFDDIIDSFNKKNEPLKIKLENYRQQKATDNNVPPFIIFNDKTMEELLHKKPKTLVQLRKINGFGEYKIELYGNDILNMIKNTIKK